MSEMIVRISGSVSFDKIVEHGDRPIGVDKDNWLVLVKTKALNDQIILNMLHHGDNHVVITKEHWESCHDER